MINLDMCGYGDKIVVSHKGNIGNADFFGVMQQKLLEKHYVETVNFLPNGDDDRFDEAHVPNISVCTLNKDDAEFFRYIGKLLQDGAMPTEEDQRRFLALDVISTMHLGANDNISSCHQLAIDKVTQWLSEGLKD